MPSDLTPVDATTASAADTQPVVEVTHLHTWTDSGDTHHGPRGDIVYSEIRVGDIVHSEIDDYRTPDGGFDGAIVHWATDMTPGQLFASLRRHSGDALVHVSFDGGYGSNSCSDPGDRTMGDYLNDGQLKDVRALPAARSDLIRHAMISSDNGCDIWFSGPFGTNEPINEVSAAIGGLDGLGDVRSLFESTATRSIINQSEAVFEALSSYLTSRGVPETVEQTLTPDELDAETQAALLEVLGSTDAPWADCEFLSVGGPIVLQNVGIAMHRAYVGIGDTPVGTINMITEIPGADAGILFRFLKSSLSAEVPSIIDQTALRANPVVDPYLYFVDDYVDPTTNIVSLRPIPTRSADGYSMVTLAAPADELAQLMAAIVAIAPPQWGEEASNLERNGFGSQLRFRIEQALQRPATEPDGAADETVTADVSDVVETPDTADTADAIVTDAS